MWKIMESLYVKNRYPLPDRTKSIFIGNHGGRKALRGGRIKKAADSSYIDRAFAYNVSIKYKTPEIFFNNEKTFRDWKYGDYSLQKEEMLQIQRESQESMNQFKHGVRHYLKKTFGGIKQFLLIAVGPPKSSKTTMINYIIDDTTDCVKREKIKPWVVVDLTSSFSKSTHSLKKCLKKISEEITYGNSIIVDGTNGTSEYRSQFIDLVKNFDNVGILIIEMCIPLKLSKHLNHMKVELSNAFDVLPTPNISFMKFTRDYDRPLIKEFLDINPKRVDIVYHPFILVNVREFWFIYDK